MPSDEDESSDHAITKDMCISKEWLLQELRSNPSHLIILDCRSSNEYGHSHIRHAINFSIPSLMLRRLAAGKIGLNSFVNGQELKAKITDAYKESLFIILYSDCCFSCLSEQRGPSSNSPSETTIQVLSKRLQQDGCQVMCLEDGFENFRGSYPEWCEAVPDQVPVVGLRSLRISSFQPSGQDSSLRLDDDRDFPVEILPHLFLGNAANSEDLDSLNKHGIKYILNVTADLPNVFEGCGSIKYMQIPVADRCSENLASYFPQAIDFIEEAVGQRKGVLVHCLAGVSRSVTITVAYLMAQQKMSLNEAFNLVRKLKKNVAPNFHFMEQLHTFEQQLSGKKVDTVRCENCGCQRPESETCKCTNASTFLSPLSIVGQSPDSGIEFDRWTPGPGE